jgi:hypothetical protein
VVKKGLIQEKNPNAIIIFQGVLIMKVDFLVASTGAFILC